MDFEEKLLAIMNCDSVDSIFSNNKIDPISDYSELVTSMFIEDDVRQGFILEMINRGNSSVVSKNLSSLSLDWNWRIAKQVPEFKEIFCHDFSNALQTEDGISPETIVEMSKDFSDNTVFTSNWQALAKITERSVYSRKELIKALEASEAGKSIVNTNLPDLFYGNYTYTYLINEVLKDKTVSREQIAGLIIEDPTRMVKESLNSTSTIVGHEFSELLDQIDEIITTTPNVDASQIARVRSAIEETIAENFDQILENTRENSDDEVEERNYSVQLLKNLKKWDTDKHKISEKFAENHDKIVGNIHESETMDLLHIYSDIDVANKKDLSLEEIMGQTFSYIKDADISWAVTKAASELLEDQGLTPDKMEVYGSGNYSKSIKVGEYIFKVGEDRSTPDVPQDERLIQPLIRRKLVGKDDETIFIELQDLVDKDWYKGLSEEEIKEELYKIYAEVRDRGHRWTDVRKENVGRLLKPNDGEYNINGQKLKSFNTAIGYQENKRKNEQPVVLQAGELVIIDTDFFYKEDVPYSYSNVSIHRELEERYQREKSEKEAHASEMLSTAIDASKEAVTQNDIQSMANSINERAKVQEFDENTIATEDKATTERG